MTIYDFYFERNFLVTPWSTFSSAQNFWTEHCKKGSGKLNALHVLFTLGKQNECTWHNGTWHNGICGDDLSVSLKKIVDAKPKLPYFDASFFQGDTLEKFSKHRVDGSGGDIVLLISTSTCRGLWRHDEFDWDISASRLISAADRGRRNKCWEEEKKFCWWNKYHTALHQGKQYK